jgi:hypothetical protein
MAYFGGYEMGKALVPGASEGPRAHTLEPEMLRRGRPPQALNTVPRLHPPPSTSPSPLLSPLPSCPLLSPKPSNLNPQPSTAGGHGMLGDMAVGAIAQLAAGVVFTPLVNPAKPAGPCISEPALWGWLRGLRL